eukprot:UN28989
MLILDKNRHLCKILWILNELPERNDHLDCLFTGIRIEENSKLQAKGEETDFLILETLRNPDAVTPKRRMTTNGPRHVLEPGAYSTGALPRKSGTVIVKRRHTLKRPNSPLQKEMLAIQDINIVSEKSKDLYKIINELLSKIPKIETTTKNKLHEL